MYVCIVYCMLYITFISFKKEKKNILSTEDFLSKLYKSNETVKIIDNKRFTCSSNLSSNENDNLLSFYCTILFFDIYIER